MRVVITGGGSGIGAALCNEYRARGAQVIAADIVGSAITCDVTRADDVERLAERAWGDGEVDLWINNAGIAIGGAAHELSLDDWRRVLDVNVLGVVHGVHAAYPRMVARRRGHIVNLASVSGLAPYPLVLPYATSKHAVVGMSLALRAEARAHGVRVSVACPGMIKTPIWERSEVRGALASGRTQLLQRISGAMSAEVCASAIARGIAANRAVIPVTAEAHVAWWLTRLSPALATMVGSGIAAFAHRLGRAGGDPTRREPFGAIRAHGALDPDR